MTAERSPEGDGTGRAPSPEPPAPPRTQGPPLSPGEGGRRPGGRAGETRTRTHGAFFAAILALLFLAGQYLPFAGILIALLCPVPIVLMRLSFPNLKDAALVVLVAAALVAALSGPIRGAVFLLLVGAAGLALAECVARRLGAVETVMVTAAAGAFGSGILLGMTLLFIEPGFLKTVVDTQKKTLERAFERQIESMAGRTSPEELAKMREVAKVWTGGMDRAVLLMPAALYVSSLFSALLNFLASGFALARFRVILPSLPRFGELRAPRPLAWVLLAGYLAAPFLNDPSPALHAAGVAGLNLVFVCALFYLAAGAATLHFMMGRARMGGGLAAVTWVMVVMNAPLTLPLLVFAGLLEQVFDWRGTSAEGGTGSA